MNILELVSFIKEVKGQPVVLEDFKEYLQYKTNKEVSETKLEELIYSYDLDNIRFTVEYIVNENAKPIHKEPYIIKDIKAEYIFGEI